MALIISLIIAVFFGLWGYKKGLFAIWPFAFNTALAVYLGVMLTPAILDMAGGYFNSLGPSANAVVMFSVTFIYFIIAQFISFIYLTKTFAISLPRLVDIIGGGILAFAGGLLITNFIIFTLTISPVRDISYVSRYIPVDNLENSSRRHIINACQFVSTCSLQYGGESISKSVDIVSRTKSRNAAASPYGMTTVPRQKQRQKSITELNE
jgi:hypothetical protein